LHCISSSNWKKTDYTGNPPAVSVKPSSRDKAITLLTDIKAMADVMERGNQE
jgi:hypothetical protein